MPKYKDFDDDILIRDERNPHPKNKTKSSKRWIIILVIVIELILIVGLSAVWYVIRKLSLINTVRLDESKIVINDDMGDDTKEVLKGYTNILLLGTDSRRNDYDSMTEIGENHTDAILVASINNDTKEVRIISVYRDCLMEIGEWNSKSGSIIDASIDKATEAVFYYGVEAAISMINRNLDMDISDFVMINWASLIEIVNSVGGVDIDINLMEQRWINRYLVDTSENTGVQYSEVKILDEVNLSDEQLAADKELMAAKKTVHLDGIQATAYARIRFGDGRSDYGRTERQRAVISQIVEKAKKINNLDSTLTAVLKNIYTSLSTEEVLRMAPLLLKYKLNMIDGGFPENRYDQPVTFNNELNRFIADPIVPVTLESNVTVFHKLLFDDERYVPSATVKNISAKIEKITGIGKDKYDTQN